MRPMLNTFSRGTGTWGQCENPPKKLNISSDPISQIRTPRLAQLPAAVASHV